MSLVLSCVFQSWQAQTIEFCEIYLPYPQKCTRLKEIDQILPKSA